MGARGEKIMAQISAEELRKYIEESEELSAQALELFDIQLLKVLFALQILALSFLDKLESEKNVIKTTSKNKQRAVSLYIDFIHQSKRQYSMISKGWARVYVPVSSAIDENLNALGIENKQTQGDEQVIEQMGKDAEDALNNMAVGIFQDIGKLFITASIIGMSLSLLRATLMNKLSAQIVEGEEIPVGRTLDSLSLQIGHDLFMEMYRGHIWSEATRAGINEFLYAGRQVAKSRLWCIFKKGHTFNSQQIISWNNETWKGKIPGKDVRLVLGGFNCIDHLYPVPGHLRDLARSVGGTLQDRAGLEDFAPDRPILGEKERKLLPVILQLHKDWNLWARKNGLLGESFSVLPERFLPQHWRQAERDLGALLR